MHRHMCLPGCIARKTNVDDCLLIDSEGNIAEATSSNVILLKGNSLYTPSTDGGCVAGVCRSWIIEMTRNNGIAMEERTISLEDVKNADEVFLTNAVAFIRWVERFGESSYRSTAAQEIMHWIREALSSDKK